MNYNISRSFGYFLEGCAGLLGLAGAGPASHEISPFLFQVNLAGLTLDEIQQVLNLVMTMLVSGVTVWRLVRPKRIAVVTAPPETVEQVVSREDFLQSPAPTCLAKDIEAKNNAN